MLTAQAKDSVNMDVSAFHFPVFVGKVSFAGSAACFGWAHGIEQELVAVSVMGGTTTIEAIWAGVMSGNSIAVQRSDESTEKYWSARYGYTSGSSYKAYKSAVPNSSYISMIMLNQSLLHFNPSSHYLYLPDIDDLEERFFRRLKKICYLPVMRPWVKYLIHRGKALDTGNARDRICGSLDSSSDYWVSKGFKIFWMKNDRNRWEKIITDGLKSKNISIYDERTGPRETKS